MRVAYACRDLASDCATGPGARAVAAAMAMAEVGHEVLLVSAELAGPWRERLADRERLSWQLTLSLTPTGSTIRSWRCTPRLRWMSLTCRTPAARR